MKWKITNRLKVPHGLLPDDEGTRPHKYEYTHLQAIDAQLRLMVDRKILVAHVIYSRVLYAYDFDLVVSAVYQSRRY